MRPKIDGRRRLALGALVLSILLVGCGYYFAGSGNLPQNVQRIYVDVFENRTSETGLESIFANDLIYEITRSKNATLTQEDQAEAVLSGVIKSLTIETISHTGTLSAQERRVQVVLDLKLKNSEGRIIWRATDVLEKETYEVVSDKLTTEQNRKNAILALSERMAQNIYYRLTDNF